MATLTYNDITLPIQNIQHFQTEIVHDSKDPNRTHCLYQINVWSMLNKEELKSICKGVTENVWEILKVIKEKLMVPRKKLSLITNSGIISIPDDGGVNGIIDAFNGPRPEMFHTMQVGDDAFIVQFSIRTISNVG